MRGLRTWNISGSGSWKILKNHSINWIEPEEGVRYEKFLKTTSFKTKLNWWIKFFFSVWLYKKTKYKVKDNFVSVCGRKRWVSERGSQSQKIWGKQQRNNVAKSIISYIVFFDFFLFSSCCGVASNDNDHWTMIAHGSNEFHR